MGGGSTPQPVAFAGKCLHYVGLQFLVGYHRHALAPLGVAVDVGKAVELAIGGVASGIKEAAQLAELHFIATGRKIVCCGYPILEKQSCYRCEIHYVLFIFITKLSIYLMWGIMARVKFFKM